MAASVSGDSLQHLHRTFNWMHSINYALLFSTQELFVTNLDGEISRLLM